MTFRTLCLALALLSTAGCAARRDVPGTITYMPDGSSGYEVTCNKPFSSEADCLTRAGQICETYGYRVVARAGEELSLNRSMMIRCNTPDGLYPGDRRQ